MEYLWHVQSKSGEESIEQLSSEINVNAALANILVNRGIKNFDEAKYFFRPKLENLHDPFLMKDMEIAVDRILKAIEENQKILFPIVQ